MRIAMEGIRQRAIEAYQAGEGTQAQVARMYRITLRTFVRWWRQYRQSGTFAPAPRGHRPAVYQGRDLEALDRALYRHPDATLAQLREQTGMTCSIMAVHRATLRLDWHYKKSRYERVSKTAPM